MNATPPVSRAPLPPASAKTGKTGPQAPDFAAALTSAAAKPARKAGGHKPAGAGARVVGGDLPADGNVSPLPASSIPAVSAATAPVGFSTGAAAPGMAGADQQSGAGAPVKGAAPGPIGTALDSARAAAPAGGAGPPITGNGLAAAAVISATTSSTTIANTAAATVTAPAAIAAAARSPSEDAGAPVKAGAAPSPAATGAVKHAVDTAAATAATAATKAATSGSSSNHDVSSPPGNAGGAPIEDAPAPSTAALSAAATGLVLSNDPAFAGAADSPAFAPDAGDLPGAGPKGPGMQAQNSAPAALSAVHSVAAAAQTRAGAQPVSMLADAGAADKRTADGAGSSPFPDIPGDAAAGAVQLGVNAPNSADAAAVPTFNVAARVDTPEFGQGITDRVTWMVDTNLNGAKLQVNPPQLGPIEVRIAVQGGHAQVWLTSHSAVTRDALESSSPKLREMLGAQGFGQVSVDISQGSFQERPAYSQPYDWTPSAVLGATTAAVHSTANPMPRTSSGALDAYA